MSQQYLVSPGDLNFYFIKLRDFSKIRTHGLWNMYKMYDVWKHLDLVINNECDQDLSVCKSLRVLLAQIGVV